MRAYLSKLISPVLTICLLAGVWAFWHFVLDNKEAESNRETDEAVVEKRIAVELPPAKYELSEVKIGTVEIRSLQAVATVAGRVDYDQAQHVNIRVATAGTITKLLVKPGDELKKGELLAVVSSPEVGQSRAELAKRISELKVLTRMVEFQKARYQGVKRLSAAIERGDAPEIIRKEIEEEQVGSAREDLLTAYSETKLAQIQLDRIQTAANSGSLPERILTERITAVETSRAKLTAKLEQILFEAERDSTNAAIALEDGNKQLDLARQKVATLLGYSSFLDMPSPPESLDENLSTVEIRSPMNGTVEQRVLAETERVAPGDSLFIVADTSTLWIEAQIREPQWQATVLKQGDEIYITSPTLNVARLPAKVHYVGRQVDPQTNSIPLVATIANDGRLKPGLFVKVELPMGQTRQCLAITSSALATDSGENFVFVPSPESDHVFLRRDIKIGDQIGDWIEVLSGLSAGDKIAIGGVFYLKSELLLEAEE